MTDPRELMTAVNRVNELADGLRAEGWSVEINGRDHGHGELVIFLTYQPGPRAAPYDR